VSTESTIGAGDVSGGTITGRNHKLAGHLGVGAIIFMIMAAAAPLTTVSATVPVAILTGNGLKDPDYTLRYHTGELYEEFTTESTMTNRGRKLDSRFANAPVVIDADEAALVAAIQKRLG